MIETGNALRPNAMRLPVELVAANAADRQRIASQQRLLAPSDDPGDWAALSSLSRTEANGAAWSANIGIAVRMGAAVDDRLASMQVAIDRTLEIAVAAGSPAFGSAARAAAIEELRGIASDVSALTQGRDVSGLPLFGDNLVRLPVGYDRTVPAGYPLSRLEQASGAMPQDAIVALADALGDPTNAALLASARDAVSAAAETVTVARSLSGADNARLERTAGEMAEASQLAEEEQSRLSAPDIAALIARIDQRQLTIDAANALYARINRVTLFDLLR